MNRKIVLLALTFAFAGVFSSPTFAQKLLNGGAPQPVEAVDGLIEAFCIKFAPDIEICKGKPAEDEYGDGKIVIRRGGREFGEIGGSINASGGETGNFQAFYGDLDVNKAKELIVVDFDSQSNGLGEKNYSISIFPDFEKSKTGISPLTFADYEFGAGGTFIYDAKTKETLVLHTEWNETAIRDPKRGAGLYFIGRFFRLKNGKLIPAAGKPLLARRLLNSFERERYRTPTNRHAPYRWLQSADTLQLKTDPAFDIKFAATEKGIVERIETVTEMFGEADERLEVKIKQLVVKLDSGERKIIVLSKDSNKDLPSDEGKIFPATFGFLPQKMLLPNGFNLLDTMDAAENRRVEINLEKPSAESSAKYYVWLVEK